jgi:hypothetical protein
MTSALPSLPAPPTLDPMLCVGSQMPATSRLHRYSSLIAPPTLDPMLCVGSQAPSTSPKPRYDLSTSASHSRSHALCGIAGATTSLLSSTCIEALSRFSRSHALRGIAGATTSLLSSTLHRSPLSILSIPCSAWDRRRRPLRSSAQLCIEALSRFSRSHALRGIAGAVHFAPCSTRMKPWRKP